MSTFITLVACAIFLLAFVMYNRSLLAGNITPSFVSWLLFSIVTLINFPSYLAMSGDWVKIAVGITDCFICLVTLGILLYRKAKGDNLHISEKLVLVVGFISIFIWWKFRSATYANLTIQAGYALGLYLTCVNAFKGKEPVVPWFIWAFAYLLAIVVVILRWRGHAEDLVNPIVCFGEHMLIGLIALCKNQPAERI